MKTALHTREPWQWYWKESNGEADCAVIATEPPGHAIVVARCPSHQTKERWEADARLLSSGPDGLQLAKAVLAYVQDRTLSGRDQITKLANDFISKAEGCPQ